MPKSNRNLKKTDKKDASFLRDYSHINWDNIMKLYDIVSPHYEKVDHEIKKNDSRTGCGIESIIGR